MDPGEGGRTGGNATPFSLGLRGQHVDLGAAHILYPWSAPVRQRCAPPRNIVRSHRFSSIVASARGALAVSRTSEGLALDFDTDPVAYSTQYGCMLHGTAEAILSSASLVALNGTVNLILTSPPFPLNTKKRYGNLTGEAYVDWLSAFAPRFRDLLADDGSLVIELGNAWERGSPVMSTLALRALLTLQTAGDFHLCQEIIWHNPARLPTPAQWVTIQRVRLKDSFTRFWWLSSTPRPKADNRRVLTPYGPHMRKLLARQSYNAGRRPSEHDISATGFLKDNGGAIPPNVLTVANTRSSDPYQKYCRLHELQPHPARMPDAIVDFFVRFLTEEGDLVLDPFGGSNTTGAGAERERRNWITIEPQRDYIRGSRGRFPSLADEAVEPA